MNQYQRLCVIAVCSTGLGIGLLRFSYTALMPMTIEQNWWSSDFASYLASANLVGYLMGAVIAFSAVKESGIQRTMLLSSILGSLSLFACGIQGVFESWYMFWRIVSGITGGLLMVLGPSFALKQAPAEKKHSISLMAFSGVGVGVLLSTTMLPQLSRYPVSWSWFVLGGLSIIMTLILMRMLQKLEPTAATAVATGQSGMQLNRAQSSLVFLVICAYFMNAIAYIPHSLFWVDFLVRGLDRPQVFASYQWMIYGVGSMFGALCAFYGAKRWGAAGTLWRFYIVYTLAIAMPWSLENIWALSISSFLNGLLNPATVSLSSTLLAEIVTTQHHRQAWGIAVMSFAIAQLIGGMGMGYLLVHGIEYQQLFILGGLSMSCAVILSIVVARRQQQSLREFKLS